MGGTWVRHHALPFPGGVVLNVGLLLAILLAAPPAARAQLCTGHGLPGEAVVSGRMWSVGGERPLGVSARMAGEQGLSVEGEYLRADEVERFSAEATWTLPRAGPVAICPGVTARRWEGHVGGTDRDLTSLDLQVGFGYPLGGGEGFDLVAFCVPAVALATGLGIPPAVGEAERQFHAGVGVTAGLTLLLSRTFIRSSASFTSYMDPMYGIGAGVRFPF